MRRTILTLIGIIFTVSVLSLYSASGTPSTLVVRTDANNYLLVTSVTQTNPVTQGVFASRTLRTDANGSLQVVLTGTVTPTYPMGIPASTCAAPSLGESGAATTGIAFTATPSILNCINGTAVTTLTGSTFTSTVPIFVPSGSTPGLSFSATGGISLPFSGDMAFTVDSARRMNISGNGLAMRNDAYIGFASGDPSSTAVNVSLSSDAADTLALKRGTNAQAFNIYHTYTSGSNYERAYLGWGVNPNNFTIETENAGASSRTLLIGTAGNSPLNFQQNSSARWQVGVGGFFGNAGVSVPTFTTDIRLFDTAVTWNNSGVTFTGWKLNVTDTASAAASLLIDVGTGGGSYVSRFSVRKDGLITGNNLNIGSIALGGGIREGFSSPADGLLNINNNGAAFAVQMNGGTAAPTVGTCGTGTITANSRNTAGGFTATGATACTLTFGTPAWTNTPFCTVTLRNAPTTTPYISAISTTAFTVSGLTAGDVIAFHCFGSA